MSKKELTPDQWDMRDVKKLWASVLLQALFDLSNEKTQQKALYFLFDSRVYFPWICENNDIDPQAARQALMAIYSEEGVDGLIKHVAAVQKALKLTDQPKPDA